MQSQTEVGRGRGFIVTWEGKGRRWSDNEKGMTEGRQWVE